MRAALGERRVSYLGYSYGAYLGAVYLQLFPGRSDRVVLDSTGDPRTFSARLQGTEEVTEKALSAWASWAAGRDSEYGLGATPAAVLRTVRQVVAVAAARPLRVGPYAVDEHVAPVLVSRSVGSDRDADRAAFAETVVALRSAANGEVVEPCVDLLVNAYFATGSLPAKDPTCQG